MDDNAIITKLTGIFHQVMGNQNIILDRETTAYDIEEWDSLSHIRLIMAVEKAFQIRLTSNDLENLDTVGMLVDVISNRVST